MKHAKDLEHKMWVEIPIVVFYSAHPEEKPEWGYNGGYPGCPAHIIVDDVQLDCQGQSSIENLIHKLYDDRIEAECREAADEESET